MKPHLAPTSPKSTIEQSVKDLDKTPWSTSQLQQPPRWPWGRLLLLIMLVSLIISLAGLAGLHWTARQGWLGPWNSWFTSTSTTVVQTVGQTSATEVPPAVQRVAKSIFGLADDAGSDGVYTTDDVQGWAVPLSRDGWLLTTTSSLPSDATKVVLPPNGSPQSITKQIRDPALPVTYINIESIAEQPVSFERLDSNNFPQTVWLVQQTIHRLSFVPRKIISADHPRWTNSDREESWLTLDVPVNNAQGWFVLAPNGHLIGVIEGETKVVPLSSVETILTSLVQRDVIERPSLGVRYLPRSEAMVANDPTAAGVLIGAASGQEAVVRRAAADQAGLRPGDIILAIDKQPIQRPLYTILTAFRPGDHWRVQYRRGTAIRETDLTLSTLK